MHAAAKALLHERASARTLEEAAGLLVANHVLHGELAHVDGAAAPHHAHRTAVLDHEGFTTHARQHSRTRPRHNTQAGPQTQKTSLTWLVKNDRAAGSRAIHTQGNVDGKGGAAGNEVGTVVGHAAVRLAGLPRQTRTSAKCTSKEQSRGPTKTVFSSLCEQAFSYLHCLPDDHIDAAILRWLPQAEGGQGVLARREVPKPDRHSWQE
eukprot:3074918-Rhodomonas_salina.4